ncbi:MAG: hypothetical protein ACJ8B6_01715 [Gemmatimonadales bacterium]
MASHARASIIVAVLCAVPLRAAAQWDRSPSDGGFTASLGQPRRWHWQAGLGAGAWFEGPDTELLLRASAGTYRDLLNPVTGIAQIGAEAFAGMRGVQFDGGLRALLRMPFIGMGMGAEYNFLDTDVHFVVTAHTPVLRGGLIRPGGTLRLNWYPTESSGFTLGLAVPLGDPLTGRGRPKREYVVVASKFPTPVPYDVRDPAVEEALDSLRVSAGWVRRLTVPFLDQDGRSFEIAQQRNAQALAELRARLAIRGAEAEVRHFHRQLELLFSRAAGSDSAGAQLAREARKILLKEVILPYNSLLGRKKHRDELMELAVAARGRFDGVVAGGRWVRADRVEAVFYAFQHLTAILEDERARANKEWDDPRLVWIPLQYALLPEDHDTQAELDKLVERATGAEFTDGNRIRYLANLQFHWELLRTVREAQDYHVLLIHDFPAVAGVDALDWAALEQVVNYLTVLAERVEAYDRDHHIPTFFIVLDQHYYEERDSHLWLDVLEDPLRALPQVKHASPIQADTLARVLDRLRTAVAGSRVLQAEARQYGQAWLRNRVSVHVNVTNRADEAFWSGGIFSSFFAYPDNLMRDHRKLAFYDVTESNPYRGRAVFTGMGVGQQYLGPTWEDRSLDVEGPMLVELKRAVRELLLSQGMRERDLPQPLQSRPRSVGYDSLLAFGQRRPGFDARAMSLTNGTGFLPKPLNVGKAVLYSLMPSGSVIKIPDSLWNSFMYAGLLVGACMRGAQVLIIAPAEANAPSGGIPQMIREWELMTRLLDARAALADAFASSGGMLQLGLYAVAADQSGLAGRVDEWNATVADTPFLTELMPFLPTSWPVVVALARPDAQAQDNRPRLHHKVQFLGTRPLWAAIAKSPEWPEFMSTYLAYRDATYAAEKTADEAVPYPARLHAIAERIHARTTAVAGVASYAIVGSQNQDYRGMFMDGEVGVLFSGPESLVPLVDLIFLEGTTTWLTDQASLDRLVHPTNEYWRRWARVLKDGV